MEQTWRWFGPDDPVSLAYVRQAGATGVVTALHALPPGVCWPDADILDRKAVIERSGLTWSVCESIPVHDAIKLSGAKARPYIDAWKDSLAALGRAGVPVVCYNFMPVVDWTRTDLAYPVASGGLALRFDWTDFVAYDAFVLKRAGADDQHPPARLSAARAKFAGMSASQVAALEANIIAGLPGGAEAFTRETLRERLAMFEGATAADLQAALRDFVREIAAVAQDCGVLLAIHPDDPPFSLFGLPRVVSTADDARAVLAASDSPANGLTMCVGSYGARADNDVVAMTREFAPRVHFAHLRNVSRGVDGSFHEAEHLDGDTDMVEVMRALVSEERAAQGGRRQRAIPLRPDHGHLLADDVGRKSNPGYSYIGRLKGLAELRGVLKVVERE